MIINVRGTSGSGKSTLMRKLMEVLGPAEEHFEAGRKRPLYYAWPSKRVVLLGHYASPCGGCDTIAQDQFNRVYKLIREFAECNVLYEGLLLSAESVRAIQLHKDGYALTVIGLNTPLEVCLESIRQRRLAKGRPDEPFEESTLKNAKSKQVGTEKTLRKMKAAGVTVLRLNREDAFTHIKGQLGL